jgi:phosphoribosylcarboxyaminoimidazole (NCAIR) mutase
MKKVLFLGAGSDKDPGFVIYKSNLNQRGITVTDPVVIESCHGCPDRVSEYSQQINTAIGKGHRVVPVLQGGYYFALPSIQATQTNVPIISVPLDFPAYQNFVLPPGNAAIGTVGMERKFNISDKKEYANIQRKKAMTIAENMLNLEHTTVAIRGRGVRKTDVQKELEKFGVVTASNSKVILNLDYQPSMNVKEDEIQIWTDINENFCEGERLVRTEKALSNAPNTLQVKKGNMGYYVAKIMSLQNPEMAQKLAQAQLDKRKTYDKYERNIIQELDL